MVEKTNEEEKPLVVVCSKCGSRNSVLKNFQVVCKDCGHWLWSIKRD